MNILLPISNALDSKALLYAEDIAVQKGAKLFILYITSPLTFSSVYAYPSILYSIANLNMDSIDTAHRAITTKIKSIITRTDKEVICQIGPQIDTIISVVSEYNIDLIICPEEQNLFDKLTNNFNKDRLAKKVSIPIMLYSEERKQA
ncbi:universal stress protein [Candidatus Epulonipiscium viviparus]|uniref:universal stress protein n=1 Tax=Candidatus Epulonipiscium viviparus TaxID=420336 RepID=UPI00016C031C|nr:universal stress protein [Candidatus Epulopiscium viviparus]